jgi:regulator of PEP synthase PpsR (kinase-PPPase family)
MLSTLHNADVVLVGVSRVAKSVTCFYLAYRGIRAANVPIVPGCPIPPELTGFDPRRVIGLTMNVSRLQAIRSSRVTAMGYGSVNHYVDRGEIVAELRCASDLMHKHHWRCIDISYLGVEEVATSVLELIEGTRTKMLEQG